MLLKRFSVQIVRLSGYVSLILTDFRCIVDNKKQKAPLELLVENNKGIKSAFVSIGPLPRPSHGFLG